MNGHKTLPCLVGFFFSLPSSHCWCHEGKKSDLNQRWRVEEIVAMWYDNFQYSDFWGLFSPPINVAPDFTTHSAFSLAGLLPWNYTRRNELFTICLAYIFICPQWITILKVIYPLPQMTFTFLRCKVNALRFMILGKECYGRKEYNLFSHILWALPELINEFCIPFAIWIEFCGWLWIP